MDYRMTEEQYNELGLLRDNITDIFGKCGKLVNTEQWLIVAILKEIDRVQKLQLDIIHYNFKKENGKWIAK